MAVAAHVELAAWLTAGSQPAVPAPLGALEEPVVIELSARDVWQLDGAKDARFVGDLDGDGTPEVAALAPRDGIEIVRVVSGATGTVIQDIPPGDAPHEHLSIVEAWTQVRFADPFDIDGDGTLDVVLGFPHAGGSSGRIAAVSGADGRALWSRDGQQAPDQLGEAVARVGDVDGDEVDDVVVSRRGYVGHVCGNCDESRQQHAPPGRLWVLSGASGRILDTVDGTQPGEIVGRSLSTIDDASGDGRVDVLVTVDVPGTDDTAFVLSAQGRGPTFSAGWGTAAVGDVDRDGRTDLVTTIGRKTYIVSGADGGTLLEHERGWILHAVGDLDGDGATDLAIHVLAATSKDAMTHDVLHVASVHDETIVASLDPMAPVRYWNPRGLLPSPGGFWFLGQHRTGVEPECDWTVTLRYVGAGDR